MAPALAWSWRNALHGVVLALPAGVASISDPRTGLALAVGVLPAAALGVASSRRQRLMGLLVGLIAAVSLLVGSVVAGIPILAVVTIFALCVGVAVLTADRSRRLAMPILMLGVPLVGVGLSLDSVVTGLAAVGLIVAGSAYAVVISLLWPGRAPIARAPRPDVTRATMLAYGIQIGLAGSIGAAIGFAIGVDHPGWACAAALMVSRPSHEVLVTRGWGRAVSVLVGALLACGVAAMRPPVWLFALLLVLVLALGTAMAGSRWYVFPFFSTYVVLSMLLLEDTATPAHWFVERVGLTLLGVGLALAAALIVPRVAKVVEGRGRG